MSTTTAAPIVITAIENEGGQRVSVFGADRAQICGAFKRVDRPCWLMYVTKTIAEVVDRSQPTLFPCRISLTARQDVEQWLELIDDLYMKAANQ